MAALAGVVIAGLLAVPRVAANPGVVLGVFPEFPTVVTVGNTNLPASLDVINGSTGLEAIGAVTITELTLVPSCGNFTPTCAGAADPGVFALSPTATGRPGTACTLRTFNITVIDPATGRVRFTAADGLPVIVGMPDIATDLDICGIDFTISVLKTPTIDTLPNDPGFSTNQIGFVSGRHLLQTTGSDQGEDVTTVLPGGGSSTTSTSTSTTSSSTTTPTSSSTSTTRPTSTSTSTTTSTSTSTSTSSPTSTSSSTSTTTPTSTSTSTSTSSTTSTPTSTSSSTSTSTSTTPSSTTTSTTSPPAGPSLTTRASRGVPVGNQIADVATLANLNNPTGTLRFQLYGPNNATCSGTPRHTSTHPVNGNGEYISSTFVPTQPGVYRWVATYSGDARNPSLGPTPCNDPNEAVTITGPSTAPVGLSTQATRGSVGSQMADVATLAGGNNPTGRLRFALYGPGDPTCSGTPLLVSSVPVNGNGEYVSSTYVPTQPGTYRWVASYSGDANNPALGPTACGDPNETVTVT